MKNVKVLFFSDSLSVFVQKALLEWQEKDDVKIRFVMANGWQSEEFDVLILDLDPSWTERINELYASFTLEQKNKLLISGDPVRENDSACKLSPEIWQHPNLWPKGAKGEMVPLKARVQFLRESVQQ